MTFFSFAQNLEDVMLWRALSSVERGFYLDVGAADPVDMSVTRGFYERGWRGVNVEPDPGYFARLLAERGEDVNLNLALAEVAGEAVFFVLPGTGLSTLDPAIAEQHRAAGFDVRETRVPLETLAEVCRRHVIGEIHFLKIDAEGAEKRVLLGADFTAFRPWIVLLEAVRPLSPEPSFAEWEGVLLAAAYHFVWFDGLNRFYVADEKLSALAPYFRVQPNPFDNFVRPAPDAAKTEAVPASPAASGVSAREGMRQRLGSLARKSLRPLVRRLRLLLLAELQQEVAELRAGQQRIERWCGIRGAEGEIIPAPPDMGEILRAAESALVTAALLNAEAAAARAPGDGAQPRRVS